MRTSAVAVGVCALAVPAVGAAASTGATSSAPSAVTTGAPAVAVVTPHADPARAFCGITWGSLAKESSPTWTGAMNSVRSGQHTCYDRVVFDVAKGSGQLGYDVRYVSAVISPTTGLPVAVAGGARMQVSINAPATKRIPASGTNNYPGWSALRQLKWVTSFEGQTDFGLGVRARLPMRVFTLASPGGAQRLVIDVAHRW